MRIVRRWIGMLLLAWPLAAQQVALSMDDAPFMVDSPRMSAVERQRVLLDTLKAEGVQSIQFVNGINGGDSPEGRAALKAWGAAGHLLANHSYSHWNYDDEAISVAAYEADILKAEALIRDLPGFTRRFRYPFLKAGTTAARRDALYAFLAEHGYGIGHVTIDTADYLIDGRIARRLVRDPKADLAPYRELYLKHLWACARFYDAWGQRVYGREIPYVLLLHNRLLNALFLGDVIRFFRAKGWTWISPEKAYADPVYAAMPKTVPAGEDLTSSLSVERGPRDFAKTWRAGAKDPDDLLCFERDLEARMDQLGL